MYRCAIRRIYYCCFHKVLKILSEHNIDTQNGGIYAHETAVNKLKSCRSLNYSSDEITRLTKELNELKGYRNHCDYKAMDIDESKAMYVINKGKRLCNELDHF